MNKTGTLSRRLAALPQYLRYMSRRFRDEVQELGRLSVLLDIMEHELLDTYFQPILHLRSGETLGHEALNRPPASPQFPSTEHFYDFAGRTDQMFRFEQYCRRMSLSRYVERLPEAEAGNGELLFVNVQPGVLYDPRYKSGETVAYLKELALAPERIVFELTERQAVQDYVRFEKVLSHYREQGFRIAVDDAGSGYNSLKTLVYLKPEFIKLDKSLIRGIHTSREQQELLGLVREYAERSSTRVIAEGIETAPELHFLQMAGVEYGQGYALGRPAHRPERGVVPSPVLQNPVKGGCKHVSSDR